MALRWRRRWQALWHTPQSWPEANERRLYSEIAWFGIVSGIYNTFASVFAVRLGAPNVWLGLLVSLPALMGIVTQIPAARFVERRSRRLRIVVVTQLFYRGGFLVIALVPWLFPHWSYQGLVLTAALMIIPYTITNVAMTGILAELVPPAERGRVVSIRTMAMDFTYMLTVLIAGKFLSGTRFPGNYQVVFAVAFVAGMLGVRDLTRLRVPSDQAGRPKGAGSVPWRTIARDRRFVPFVIAAFVVTFAFNYPAALHALYRVRTLHANDAWIGLLGSVELGVAVAASYFWSRVCNRLGHARVLLIAISGVTLYPLVSALCNRIEPILIVAVIGGVFGPAFNIGIFNHFLESAPREGLPAYVAVFNGASNCAVFLAPMLGTTVASMLGARDALFVSAGIVAVASVLFAAYVRRTQSHPNPAASHG